MNNKRRIKRLLAKENPLILEIGSSDGTDTLQFLRHFRDVRIYCFEPDPRAIAEFKRNIRDERCSLAELAVSDKDGEAVFYLSGGGHPNREHSEWIYSSSIKKPCNHLEKYPWCTFNKKITVKTVKLDTWVERNDIPEIDFIWADIQGAERELIAGGIKTLNEKTRYFFTEYSDEQLYENQPTLAEILTLLPNFQLAGVYGEDVLLRNKKFPEKTVHSRRFETLIEFGRSVVDLLQ